LANPNPQTTARTQPRKAEIKDFDAEAGEDDKGVFGLDSDKI
jgi:hypothetical protein